MADDHESAKARHGQDASGPSTQNKVVMSGDKIHRFQEDVANPFQDGNPSAQKRGNLPGWEIEETGGAIVGFLIAQSLLVIILIKVLLFVVINSRSGRGVFGNWSFRNGGATRVELGA